MRPAELFKRCIEMTAAVEQLTIAGIRPSGLGDSSGEDCVNRLRKYSRDVTWRFARHWHRTHPTSNASADPLLRKFI